MGVENEGRAWGVRVRRFVAGDEKGGKKMFREEL